MRTIITATLLTISATPVAAMDSFIVGPRALGMGGAGTAATDDNTASFWNPGMYGFFHRRNADGTTLASDPNDVGRRTWGIGFVDAVIGYEIRGRLADNVQQLADSNLSKLSGLNAATATANDLQTAVTALTLLQNFDAGHDTVALNANIGVMGIRIGHVGIGARQFAQGFVSIADKDLTNIGIAVSGGLNVLDAINTPTATPTGWTTGFSNLIPVGSQAYTDLTVALGAVVGGSTSVPDAISKLDYAASQAGLTEADLTAIGSGTGALINAINNITTDVNQNVTAVFTGGFTVAELPVTYGYALNDQLSIGVNGKLMIGKVAAAKARLISGTDKLSTLLQDAFDKSEQTVTGGIDVGIVWRNSWLQA
ncbi:MAG: hypothetical protein AAB263_04955, partial [Planctomycetota bacterium]